MHLKTTFLIAASMGALGNPVTALAQPSQNLSPQVRLVADFMTAQGEENIVILDKNDGKLILIHKGELYDEAPALYGRGKGETEADGPATTPAGTFFMNEYQIPANEYEGGLGYAFLITDHSYMIHPVWNGDPSEQRDKRLATPDPRDNAISRGGCINISYKFYLELEFFLNSNKVNQPKEDYILEYFPKLAVLPLDHDPNLKKTRSIFGISESQAKTVVSVTLPNNDPK